MYYKSLRDLQYTVNEYSALTLLVYPAWPFGQKNAKGAEKVAKEKKRMDSTVIFRCSIQLREKLENAATASGLTLGDVIRRRLSGVRVPNKDYIVLIHELRVLRQELIRQGGLIKHLYNEAKFEPELTRQAWNKQIAVMDEITNLIIRMEAVGKETVGNDREDGGKT